MGYRVRVRVIGLGLGLDSTIPSSAQPDWVKDSPALESQIQKDNAKEEGPLGVSDNSDPNSSPKNV